MANTKGLLRGLNFNAEELRQERPEWSDAFIEDYLNRRRNEDILADSIDAQVAKLRLDSRRWSYFYGRVY